MWQLPGQVIDFSYHRNRACRIFRSLRGIFIDKEKLSQTKLADKSGMNLKSLSRYELDTNILLADALQVSADSLLTDDVGSVKDLELLRKFEVIQELTGAFFNISTQNHFTQRFSAKSGTLYIKCRILLPNKMRSKVKAIN